VTDQNVTHGAADASKTSTVLRRIMGAINAVTFVGGIVLSIMSFWPGYAGGCIALLALPLIALLGLAWLVVAARVLPRPWGRGASVPLRSIIVAPLLVVATFALLLFYVPRRATFAACRSAFDRQLSSPPSVGASAVPLDRWLGIYHVDEWASDQRGGVYFRTGTGPDGIGPDTMSYGFVYRPNREAARLALPITWSVGSAVIGTGSAPRMTGFKLRAIGRWVRNGPRGVSHQLFNPVIATLSTK